MFKIALTAGHYKYTAGKRCLKALDPKETREWTLNDRIADKIENLLKVGKTKKLKYDIADIDLMSGAEFEGFVTYVFKIIIL